jgi:membrane protease subunit HflK
MSSILSEPAPQPAQIDPEPPDQLGVKEPYWSRRRIIIGLVVIWLLSGIFLVQPDQQAVVTRFGAVTEKRVLPGIHYAMPWPIDVVTKLKVQQLQRLVIGGDIPDSVLGRSNPLAAQFITGDQNIINMRVVVQYYVGEPADYLFGAQDVAKAIGAAVEAELARRVAHGGVDAVLTTEKTAIQDETRAAAQKRINDYHAGVVLSTVNIENVSPPAEAADAFRDVTNARADTTRIVNEAEGYANDLIPRARGEAEQLRVSAEAYKLSKVNLASGDAARFDEIEREYAKAADVTGHRLYVETMEQIMPKIKKMVIDPDGNLDLTILRKGDPAPAAPAKKP